MIEKQNPNTERGEGLFTYKGFLEFYTEAETEGAIWVFWDERFINGKDEERYKGFHILQDGDELTIYDKDKPEEVVWKGTVSLTPSTGLKESVFGWWIHNDQIGTERETWAMWLLTEIRPN